MSEDKTADAEILVAEMRALFPGGRLEKFVELLREVLDHGWGDVTVVVADRRVELLKVERSVK